MRETKVYLSGGIYGSYRSQNYIKAMSDLGVMFVYNPERYFLLTGSSRVLRFRLVKWALWSAMYLFHFPARLFNLAAATHMLILPMSATSVTILEMVIARLLGVKVMVDFYISEFDSVVNDLPALEKRSLTARRALRTDRALIKYGSQIIFLNESEKNYYLEVLQMEKYAHKARIIPLCIDYIPALDQPSKARDRDILQVCWWGSYLPLHGLEKIIHAFALLGPSIARLTIFGNSDGAGIAYQRLIDELKICEFVELRNDLTFKDGDLAAYLMEHCDLALGNFGDSLKARTVLANKVVDAAAMRIPCLTMNTAGRSELFRYGSQLVADSRPEEIAKKIADFSMGKEKDVANIARSAFQDYLKTFSPDRFRHNVASLLEV